MSITTAGGPCNRHESDRWADLLGVGKEYPANGVGGLSVKLDRDRVEVFGGLRRVFEVTVAVFATHQRRAVPLTDDLFALGRHIVQREADASIG